MTDTECLNFLETFWADFPHAIFRYNDDPDQEDDDGALLPVGFSIYLEGCDCYAESAPGLRLLVEKIHREAIQPIADEERL